MSEKGSIPLVLASSHGNFFLASQYTLTTNAYPDRDVVKSLRICGRNISQCVAMSFTTTSQTRLISLFIDIDAIRICKQLKIGNIK